MNILHQALSKLKVGDRVKLTQVNGQTIEGIISENDGAESFAIQICKTAILSYAQIASAEIESAAMAPQFTTASENTVQNVDSISNLDAKTADTEEIVDTQKYGLDFSDKTNLSLAFQKLEGDIRRAVLPVYSRALNFIQHHDQEKLISTLQSLKDVIAEMHLERNKDVQVLYAYLLAFGGKAHEASCIFGAFRMYLEAFCCAESFLSPNCKDRNLLLQDAVLFAAFYLGSLPDEDYIGSAIEILKKYSLELKDLGGMQYLVSQELDGSLTLPVWSVLKHLAKHCGIVINDFSNLPKCIKILHPQFPSYAIAERIQSYRSVITSQEPIAEPVPVTEPATSTQPEKNEAGPLKGRIIKYKFTEETGTIQAASGETYTFALSDVGEAPITAQLKKIKTSATKLDIPVRFSLTRRYGQYFAEKVLGDEQPKAKAPIVPVQEVPPVAAEPAGVIPEEETTTPLQLLQSGNVLFTNKAYESAFSIFQSLLNTDLREDAMTGMLNTGLALISSHNKPDYYMKKMAQYESTIDIKTIRSSKLINTLHIYYMKTQQYHESLECLERMEDGADANLLAHISMMKSKCYRNLGEYDNAIAALLEFLERLEDAPSGYMDSIKVNTVYPTLVELYLKCENLDEAEKYLSLIPDSLKRKQTLRESLISEKAALYGVDAAEYQEADTEESDAEEDAEEETVSLAELFAAYEDDGKPSFNDRDVLAELETFQPQECDCLLTYLSAAANAADKLSEPSAVNQDFTVGQAISVLETSFSYAFHNPIRDFEYNSTEILSLFQNTAVIVPQSSDTLFAASALRTLFQNSIQPDYGLDDLIAQVEQLSIHEKYPSLLPACKSMQQFFYSTGLRVDAFAQYRSNQQEINRVTAAAADCLNNLDLRSIAYENQGQVRKTREIIFLSDESALRTSLKIAAENNLSQYAFAQKTMQELFIRSGQSISEEHIDTLKIDSFIDSKWEEATDQMIQEGYHISHVHDKCKGHKRNILSKTIRKVIGCICDWLEVAEFSENHSNYAAQNLYQESAPQLCRMLSELMHSAEEQQNNSGFDWGTESLFRTAKELLAKLDGTFDSRSHKYFFINFLRGEDILLGSSFLPELESTFLNDSKMSVFERLRHHRNVSLPSFTERIDQIFSNEEVHHNFRSAALLMEYGKDMGISEITEHPMMSELNNCTVLSLQRMDAVYNEFNNELELFDNRGAVSDVNGEKSRARELVNIWYRISRVTNDCGFFVRILDAVRRSITNSSKDYGERLTKQLEELAANPEYDFGVYSKEAIADFIEEQNYTVAETLINCVRRHDTNNVTDYTIEPFSYLNDFISEYTANARIVTGAGVALDTAVLRSVGVKELETAIRNLTHNVRKGIVGGVSLISNWMPKGGPTNTTRLGKLLSALGFKNCLISKDMDCADETYLVKCKKQSGKISYPHPIPAFGSLTKTDKEGFRVVCLYGTYLCDALLEKCRQINTAPKHTIILLDYAMNLEERRKLARKIKEEATFAKSFIVVDRVVLFYLAKHYSTTNISRMLMAITMPFAYYQPFVEKSKDTMPPELFTGRERELVSIESADGANLVYGGRQLGKSALLKMAQQNVDGNSNGDRALLVDILDLDYTAAASYVASKLIAAKILTEACQTDDWNVLAGHIEARLQDDNPNTSINYLLLMLDEADRFIESSKEVNYRPISVLKNLPSGRFKIVMAGLHNLSRFNRETVLHRNSILVHLESIVIRPFQRPEAIKLLTNTLAYLGFRFSDDVISLILAKTNYFPGLIQLYCQKLLEAMKNGDYAGYLETESPSYEVTENHIKKVLSDPNFMEMITQKLEITLFVEEEGHSSYHIIALLLAFLFYSVSPEHGYSAEELLQVAKEYHITRLTALKQEQLTELLNEMWDLNILSAVNERYELTTGFREMLGSQETIEQHISEYIGEGDSQ